MVKFPKKETLENRVVVGVDEFNNGESHKEVPFICVAHPFFPGDSKKVIKKKYGFSKKKQERKKFIEEALEFLKNNSNFAYFTIKPSEDPILFSLIRGTITARLIYETVTPIFDQNPLVVIDGKPFNREAESIIIDTLSKYRLPKLDLFFRKKADLSIPSVKKADRIAYCLGALRFSGGKRRWPYRQNKIDFNKPVFRREDLTEILYSYRQHSKNRI